MKGRVSKSPIGDVGSLLWRRRSATLAAKELRPRGYGVCIRFIQLSSAESLRFFISFLESPGCFERISTGVIVTFSMEWLYLMKWSYKKFLYLRLQLFRILNEWLRKRPLRLWDVSPTYWAPQPLAPHVITYIKFELFQSTSLSIWMPYLLPLMEDVILDLHEIWWHVKHLLALHMDILENHFFFSPPAHLCAVTFMTEISLIVTLNNQFTSPLRKPSVNTIR